MISGYIWPRTCLWGPKVDKEQQCSLHTSLFSFFCLFCCWNQLAKEALGKRKLGAQKEQLLTAQQRQRGRRTKNARIEPARTTSINKGGNDKDNWNVVSSLPRLIRYMLSRRYGATNVWGDKRKYWPFNLRPSTNTHGLIWYIMRYEFLCFLICRGVFRKVYSEHCRNESDESCLLAKIKHDLFSLRKYIKKCMSLISH